MRIAKNVPMSGRVLAVGTLAIVLVAVALLVSVRPHQGRPVPVPMLAPVSEPPAAVKDGIAALRKACSAWPNRVPARLSSSSPPAISPPESNICQFLLHPGDVAWSFGLLGGIFALSLLIAASAVLGAARVAFAGGGRVTRALLSHLSPWLSGI